LNLEVKQLVETYSLRAMSALAAILLGITLPESAYGLGAAQKTPAGISAFDSVLSANGKVRAFVSDQAGNLDVFTQNSSEGSARPISSHPADDFSPSLNQKGKKIAFVSRRDDSLGDLYVMDLGWSFWGSLLGPERAMLRIKREQSEDRDPAFVEQKKWIYFATRPVASSKFVLAKYDFESERVDVYDQIVGEQPAPSVDGRFVAIVRAGKISIYDFQENVEFDVVLPTSSLCSSPIYSPDNDYFYASCRLRDSNNDGVLTVEDAGTIVRLQLDPHNGSPIAGLPEQLTSYSEDANYPAVGRTGLEFSMVRHGAQRIFGIPQLNSQDDKDDGKNYQHKDEQASEIESARRRTFYASNESTSVRNRIVLEEIDLVAMNGSLIDLTHSMDRIKLMKDISPEVIKEADIALNLRLANANLFPHGESLNYEDTNVKRLEQELESNSTSKFTSAWSQIALARLAATRGKMAKTRQLLTEYLQGSDVRTALRPYADFLLASALQMEVGEEAALRSLPGLLKQYPDSIWLQKSVGDYVCRLLRTVDAPQALLASMRRDLKGEVQTQFKFSIATANCARLNRDFVREESDLKDALALDEKAIDSIKRAEALWRLIDVLTNSGRAEDAEAEVKKFERSISSEKGDHLNEVRNKTANFWRQRAAKLVQINEAGSAAKRYEEAILKNDQDIEAHRGYIDAMARRGEAERVFSAYQKRFIENPSPLLRYYVGLITSYLADNNPDPAEKNRILRRAADEIEAARKENSANSYFHQTLGWIYHQMSLNMNRIEREQQQASIASKAMTSISGIFYPKEDGLLKLALREYEVADQLADPESGQRILIAQNLAEVYAQLGNPRKSLLYAVKRLSEVDVIPFTSEEQSASFYLLAARSAFDSDQLELSVDLNKKAIAQFETTTNKRQIIICLELLALSMRELSRFEEALKLYDRLEQLYGTQDPHIARNNQLNRAYCMVKTGRDKEAAPIMDGVEVALRADPGLMLPPQKTETVVISLDKKTASYGRFDNFMRLLLIISLRIEIAERQNKLESIRNLWKSKYELMEAKRSAAISSDLPVEYLSYELALASSSLGYLAAKSGLYIDSVNHFELSLQWFGIFLKGEVGTDEVELKLAKNLAIALSSAIKAEETSAEPQKERIEKVRRLTQLIVDKATQQSLPKPPLAIEVLNLLDEIEGSPLDSRSNLAADTRLDLEQKTSDDKQGALVNDVETDFKREERQSIFQDASRSWQFLAQRGHWKMAAEELKIALEKDVVFLTMDTRRQAMKVVEQFAIQLTSDAEVAISELSRFGDLWAAEILRRSGTDSGRESSKKIVDFDPWTSESLKSALDERTAMLLIMKTGNSILFVCTNGRKSLILNQDDSIDGNPCDQRFESIDKWYLAPLAGSMKVAEQIAMQIEAKKAEVRFLPYPSAVFEVNRSGPPFFERAYIVSIENQPVEADSASLEMRRIGLDDFPSEKSMAVGIDGDLLCQSNQSSTARFAFDDKIQDIPATEAVAQWSGGAKNLVISSKSCVGGSQIMDESWIALSSVAISKGVKSIYFIKSQTSEKSHRRKELLSMIEALFERQIGRSGKGPIFSVGLFSETREEYQTKAREQLDVTIDEMFDAFDNRDYAGASSSASSVMGFASALDESTTWAEAAEIAVRSRFALGDFSGALRLQKIRLVQLGSELSIEEQISMNLSALAIAIKASETNEAIRFLNAIKEVGGDKLKKDQLRELARYQALIAQLQQNYESAVNHYLESRSLSRAEGDLAGAVERDLDIGNVYREHLSNYPKALEYYQSALAAASKLKDPELHARVLIDYANTLIATGQVFEAIDLLEPWTGKIKSKLSKLSILRLNQVRAVAYYQAGVFQRAKEINDEMLVEMPPSRDFDLEAIRLDAQSLKAMIEGRFGDIPAALRTLEEGIERALQLRLYSRASTRYNNLGYWARQANDFEVAAGHFEKALEIDRRFGIKSGEAYDLRNLAYTFLKMGQLERAKSNFEQSMKISLEAGLAINKIHVLMGIGELFMREDKFTEAESQFIEALRISTQGGLRDLEWRAYGAIAQAAIGQMQYDKAHQKLQEAINIIESLRTSLNSVAGRSGFLAEASVQTIYEQTVDVLMYLKRPTEAWEVSERARSRAFIDSLGTQRNMLASPEESRILSEEIRLRSSISSATGDEAIRLRREYQELAATIQIKYPKLLQISTVQAITLDELKRVLPKDVVLVEYMVTEGLTHIWGITAEAQSAHTIKYGRSEIENDLHKLQAAMKEVTNVDSLLQKMGENLIGKLMPILSGAKRIAIVPHGPLHHLPFAALALDQKLKLIDLLPVHYLESATLARFVYGTGDQSRPAKLVALGNPDRGVSLDLPFAKREVESIGRSLSGSRVLSGKSASESNLKKFAAQANYLHIASHGEFNSVQPLESRLLLTKDETDDGDLKASEIFGLKLNDTTVVLSACETGLGQVSQGDEIIGMNRAFLFAGASSLISSLWRISDVASAVTMKRFYRGIATGDDKDASLRRAQLAVKDRYSHPAYWAPMRLIGAYR
jgi:CHAT domain-containing protein